MTSPLIAPAEEAKDLINAESWSLSFTAVRSYADWDVKLAEDDGTEVLVDVVNVASLEDTQLEDRAGDLNYPVKVHVAVRKKFVPEDDRDETTGRILNTSIDPLVELVDDIHRLFVVDRFTDNPAVTWRSTRILTCPDRRHLREHSQFLGIVELGFDVYREAD